MGTKYRFGHVPVETPTKSGIRVIISAHSLKNRKTVNREPTTVALVHLRTHNVRQRGLTMLMTSVFGRLRVPVRSVIQNALKSRGARRVGVALGQSLMEHFKVFILLRLPITFKLLVLATLLRSTSQTGMKVVR